nr:Hsp70 family protein [Vulgatibacter incomptus]
MSIGIDFGTSNSAAAIVDAAGRSAVLPLDSDAADPRLFRSVIFFPAESREVLVADEAISRYLDEWEGRFVQSAKSFLKSPTFTATEIRQRRYKLEELVAIVLRAMRVRAEEIVGAPVERAVFGRPAVFSPEPERDRLAEERLAAAAEIAGFPRPTFLIEPIAAALGYEESLNREEVVLVGDFGAGTSDFTLMRLGPSRAGNLDRRGDVIASDGVYIGGDDFDSAIVEHRLLERFGAGSTYLSLTRRMPLPAWIARKLLAWHELALLRERSTMEFLKKAKVDSDQPEALGNLIRLVEDNLAFHLYRSVEAAKRELSGADEAKVRFHESGIELDERVTRAEFEAWTAPLRAELDACVDRVLARSGGVEPDAIFLTGGTSKIPSVRALFAERFGEARLREGDAFTSVVAGLGRATRLAG